MAADSGGVDSVPDLRRAGLGDEGVCCDNRARLSDCVNFRLGLRAHSTGYQTDRRGAARAINRALNGAKLDFAIITILTLAVGLLLFDRFRSKPQTHESGKTAKSIAVLPFENLSDDKGSAYFVSGIRDEVLTN